MDSAGVVEAHKAPLDPPLNMYTTYALSGIFGRVFFFNIDVMLRLGSLTEYRILLQDAGSSVR